MPLSRVDSLPPHNKIEDKENQISNKPVILLANEDDKDGSEHELPDRETA